jgi:simple sugar transport system substrate-binding protein
MFLCATFSFSQAKQYSFYVVAHGGPSDPYWARVMRGMEEAAAMINANGADHVKAVYLAPTQYSVAQFLEMLNSAIDSRPDGIVVSMPDYTAEDAPLRAAISKGIPVIAIDLPDPRAANQRIPYQCFVGADLYLYAKAAAAKVLAVRKPKRAVVFIHEVGNKGLEVQAQGFIDAMAKAGVPAERLATGLDPSQALEIARGYFSKHPETDAIFSLGPLGNQPAITYIHEEHLEGKVILGCKDFDVLTLKAIQDGTALFTLVPQQYLMGYIPIQFLYLQKKYGFKMPEQEIITGPTWVDSSNVALVAPLVERGYW